MMWAFTLQRLACIFVINYLVFYPKINVDGTDDIKDMEQTLPSDYKQTIASGTFLNSIWGSYSVRYAKGIDNATSIILSGPYTQGWVSIGLSKTGGMLGSSAMVGWTSASGENLIKQYSLEGYNPSKVIANKGELQLTKVAPACTLSKGNIYMAFQLKFPNNNMKQKVIFAASPSYPDDRDVLTMHKEVATKEIDFSKGAVVVDNSVNIKKVTHGVLGMLAWLVFIPLGIKCPKHFKRHDPLWFNLHIAFQCMAYVFTVINIILGLKVAATLQVTKITLHKYLGIFVIVLATLQIFALFARPAKDSSNRPKWNVYHHGVGYLAKYVAWVNILIGILVAHGVKLWLIFLFFFVVADLVSHPILGRMMTKARQKESHDNNSPVFNVSS